MLQGGSTPLHYAAFHGYQEAVKILADGEATIDVVDEVSYSCMRSYNNYDVYCLLIHIIHTKITGSFSFEYTSSELHLGDNRVFFPPKNKLAPMAHAIYIVTYFTTAHVIV